MLRPIDKYFLQYDEPVKSCLQFLRNYILQLDKNMVEKWKYGAPFYFYKDKRICYLWVHKKYSHPYIGIVDGLKINHPDLLQEKRTRMKILLIDPGKNIPVRKIKSILTKAISINNL